MTATFLITAKIMIITAAAVIHMSATLKIAKCGNWKKSTTWPRRTPGRPEQPVDQVAGDPGTEQTEGDRPAEMAERRHQFQDHVEQHADRRDGEHGGEVLTLTEGRTRVPDQPKGQQAAEQPNRHRGCEPVDDQDLADDVEGQAADHHCREEQSQPRRGRRG